jgi:hypothetical protein
MLRILIVFLIFESPFGSLTNKYGDRIKTLNVVTTQIRILARVIAYQVKLLMRILKEILRILRHPLYLKI